MDKKVKRLLVTGAAGFIGTNFLNRIRNNPEFEVQAVFHVRKPRVHARNVGYVQADLRDFRDCQRVVADMDYVCMFAGRLSTAAILAKNPLGPVAENTVIQTQMLEAAHLVGVRKFLWCSSTTGYPAMGRPLKEEDFFISDPPSPYEPVGWMSRYIEKLAALYATKPKSPMAVIALRSSGIFGEFDDFNYETCHALPAIVRRVVERESPVEVWGDGEDGRDWLYVDDLIDACLLALEKIDGYEALNIGCGKTCSVNELLAYLLELDGYTNAQIVHRAIAPRHVLARRFDCSKAKIVLGFKAKTPINEGLARTVTWYRENRLALVGLHGEVDFRHES